MKQNNFERTGKDVELSETVTLNETSSGHLTKENINTLVMSGIIPKGTAKEQIVVFSHICREHGLSPFSREIYLTRFFSKKDNEYKYIPIVGVDGLRKKAARTGLLAGIDPPEYNRQSDGTYQTAAELAGLNTKPISCFVRVWKIVAGQRVAFGKDVVFAEMQNRNNDMAWKTMPLNQLAVVAEKHSLRQAFAAETSGLFVQEEMGPVKMLSGGETSEDIAIADWDSFVTELTRKLSEVQTEDELQELYKSDKRHWHYDDLREMFEAERQSILAQKTADNE